MKHNQTQINQDSHYQTGRTQPPKSHRGLIAFLLVCVIFLSGVVTALGAMNIHLFQQLNAPTGDASLAFSQNSGNPQTDSASNALSPDLSEQVSNILGFTGHTLTALDRMIYHLPEGIYITHIKPESDAAAGGILPGDVLVSCNHLPVTDSNTLSQQLSDRKSGVRVTLGIYRNGQTFSVIITPDFQK